MGILTGSFRRRTRRIMIWGDHTMTPRRLTGVLTAFVLACAVLFGLSATAGAVPSSYPPPTSVVPVPTVPAANTLPADDAGSADAGSTDGAVPKSDSGSSLASTGAAIGGITVLAVVLLAGGGALVLTGRRRRANH